MTSSTRKGVRLTLPGAGTHPYEIPGLRIPLTGNLPAPLQTQDDVDRAQALIDAGAPVEIVDLDRAEPWKGYTDQPADDIVKRLDKATVEQASEVVTFEQANKNRSTVLDAAAARISTLEEA